VGAARGRRGRARVAVVRRVLVGHVARARKLQLRELYLALAVGQRRRARLAPVAPLLQRLPRRRRGSGAACSAAVSGARLFGTLSADSRLCGPFPLQPSTSASVPG